MSDDQHILDWLRQFALRWRRQRAAGWMIKMIMTSFIVLMIVALLDRWLAFSESIRAIGLTLYLLPIVFLVLLAIVSSFAWPFDHLKMSRVAERFVPALEGRLSTWVSQSKYSTELQSSSALRDRLAKQIIDITRATTWPQIFGRSFKRRHYYMMLITMALIGTLFCIPKLRFPQLVARIVQPWKQIPPVTSTQIRVETGSVKVRQGSGLTIVADVTGAESVRLKYKPTPVDTIWIDMQSLGGERYGVTIPNLIRPADYQVHAGDAVSDWYRIDIERN